MTDSIQIEEMTPDERLAALNEVRHFCQREISNISSATRRKMQEVADKHASQTNLLLNMHQERNKSAQQLFGQMDRDDREITVYFYENPPKEDPLSITTYEALLKGYCEKFVEDIGRTPTDEERHYLSQLANQAISYLIKIRNAVDIVIRSHNRHPERKNIPTVDELLAQVHKAKNPEPSINKI